MAKNGSATNDTGFPDPALTNVPDPQPKTTCIATPNTKAPAIIAKPIGACAPFSSPPWFAINGKAKTVTIPIANNCAHNPDGSRRRIIARHGPANPNRNPSRARPKPSPTASISPYRAPASAATVKTTNTAATIRPPRFRIGRGAKAPAITCSDILETNLVQQVTEQARSVFHRKTRVGIFHHRPCVEFHVV